MIKVTVLRQDNLIKSIEIKGHAGSGPKSHDLVCAAVSAIVTGGFNALDAKGYDFLLEEGHAKAVAKKLPSDNDAVVLKTMLTQLQTVEEEDPEFVKIEIL